MIEIEHNTVVFYDFHKMFHAIEEKHNINFYDVNGSFKDVPRNPDKEYQNFWHFLVDLWEINNGCQLEVNWAEIKERLSSPHYFNGDTEYVASEWIMKCVDLFVEEFGYLETHIISIEW
jgi:hypothetical protein